MKIGRPSRLLLAVGVAAAVMPGAARAAFPIAVERPSANGTDLGIALLDASSGQRLPLPAGVNTSADELHPSLTADRRRMVFERVDRTAGTVRIILVDLQTGVRADLFSAFDASALEPVTPSISADGNTVVTGAPLITGVPGSPAAALVLTDVRSFPTGPFPHQTLNELLNLGPISGGTVSPVLVRSGQLAFALERQDHNNRTISQLEFQDPTNRFSTFVQEANTSHPALAADHASVLVFERSVPLVAGGQGPAELVFRPIGSTALGSQSVRLPPVVNPGNTDQSRPAFTADERYLAFVRHGVDGHDRLLVFDAETQLLLSSGGVDLGPSDPTQGIGQLARTDGNVAVFHQSVLGATTLSPTTVTIKVSHSTKVGLLLRRVVGHHQLLGRRVPTLQGTIRIPLGRQGSGRLTRRWRSQPEARHLAPGLYQITVRSLGGAVNVTDLGRPALVRIGPRVGQRATGATIGHPDHGIIDGAGTPLFHHA